MGLYISGTRLCVQPNVLPVMVRTMSAGPFSTVYMCVSRMVVQCVGLQLCPAGNLVTKAVLVQFAGSRCQRLPLPHARTVWPGCCAIHKQLNMVQQACLAACLHGVLMLACLLL